MRQTGAWLLILLGATGVVGCHLIPAITGLPARTDFAPQASDKEKTAGAPSKFVFPVSQFVFASDFEIQSNLPIFKELASLREQIYRELRLQPSNTQVTVHLFEDQEKYERFMKSKYPDLPKRRAFFVAQPRRLGGGEDLLVFTYWGGRIQTDLRHELTHAVLHSVLRDVPLWLDEGLAEYFEVGDGWNGVNFQHVGHLRQTGVTFDLDRLEKLTDVQQMSPAEYREAWAWVHLMLQSTPQAKQALVAYLQDLRTNPRPGPLRPRLSTTFLSLDNALRGHLADIDLSKQQPTAARAER